MKVEQETRDGVLILHLAGRLDNGSSPGLERLVMEQIDAGACRLVFDLSALDYINSAGLQTMLLTAKKLRARQGQMALAGLRGMVREVFDMSGFLTLFVVASSVAEGMARV